MGAGALLLPLGARRCQAPRTDAFAIRSIPSAGSSSRRAASPSPTSSPPAGLEEALARDQGDLEGPDLHPAGDPLGLPRPGPQRRPVLPRRRRPPDRPPRRAGAASRAAPRRGRTARRRKRLPERFFAAVARLVGRNLDARVDRRWLWKGRRVCLFDGSTVSMPDTPENRASTPWPTTRCPGPASPSPGSGRSSRCRAGRSSTWASAATPARARGRSACCGGCGTCSAPATCCWGTA